MKKLFLLSFCLFVCLAFAQQTSGSFIRLNKDWQFSEAGTNKWLSATVPGTVQGDLISHKLLPNPFFGNNEDKIQWVENKDWEYKTTFTVTQEQLQNDAATLVFEGLDTYADVYLNGSLLLKSDNMFVGYSSPVKQVLRVGENKLNIYFHSPITSVLPQWASNGFDYPADNDHLDKKLSIFTRKAPYSYGWDWGIRMVTSGVWRPITLNFYNLASIDDLNVRQLNLSDKSAQLSNDVEITGVLSQTEKAELTINCTLEGKSVSSKTIAIDIQPGKNKFSVPMEIADPQRWMPHGWGKPVLYNITATINRQAKAEATKSQRIGLRTIRLVNEKDAVGESYYFEVNGIPMYAKGANYIPSDAILTNVTTERYQEIFRNITAANMNIVRVWGGGTYEDNRFYDLADENGILVWQDFMFGCTTYPHDPTFLKRVTEETTYNIKRLRNHACLAMWCGNNEILEGMQYWGWEKRYTPEVYKDMYAGYDEIFKKLLPAQVAKYDAGRSYVHGSPLSTTWGRSETWAFGDSHNWGVWYGKKKFESFDTETGRFMSEFGFQSFPEMKTIAAFANPEDYALESKVMNGHQKSSIGNSLIKTYMERDNIIPEKFEDFVYVGLILQGKGMRYGFEAQRRNRPYCMGTIYWQLNDSWPVVSWSGIDYFGNWKALHYQAKRAYEPVLISPVQKNDSLLIYLVSDKLENFENVSLDMQWKDFNGKLIKKSVLNTKLPSNSSTKVFEQAINDLLTSEQRKNTFLQLTLKDKKGVVLNEQTYFIDKTKDLDVPTPKISVKTAYKQGVCELTLSTDKLAKDVFIEFPVQGAQFTDNFFDMKPGEKKVISISSPQISKDSKFNISVKHIRQTYK
jgi:beta-mannosidase